MSKPPLRILSRNRREGLDECLLKSLSCASASLAQVGFEFREGLLNGRKIRGVGRQKEHLASASFDSLTNAFSFVDLQSIHHHDLPWLQARPQDLLDLQFEGHPISGSL